MTFSRTLTFACTLLFVSPPVARASFDSVRPAAVSFAYSERHPVTALPAAVIERMARGESDSIGDESALNMPPELPREIGVAPARRLTRSDVCNAIESAARANDLPVSFFANLIWQESNFDAGSVSRAGAQGIAQFMPRTAYEFGLMNPFEPIDALFAAGRFLRKLTAQFGNLGLAAAAYNAGPKRVLDWLNRRGGLPNETRGYVRKITGRPAEQWTPAAVARGPEAALMPVRAPCYAALDEVEAQAKMVRVAKLIGELAASSGTARGRPEARPGDDKARVAAATKPAAAPRAWSKFVAHAQPKQKPEAKPTRTAAAVRPAVAAARSRDRIAAKSQGRIEAKSHDRIAAKSQDRVTGKSQDRVARGGGGPARRDRYASAR